MFPSYFRNSNFSFKINLNEDLGTSTSCDIFITIPALLSRKQIYLNPLGSERVRNVGLSVSVFYSHSSLLNLYHQTLHCESIEDIAPYRIQQQSIDFTSCRSSNFVNCSSISKVFANGSISNSSQAPRRLVSCL